MRLWKLASGACLAALIGSATASATIVTLNDTFYASGFTTPQKGAVAAPVDPVYGSFSITFDNSIAELYLSPTNQSKVGVPSNFTISSNIPGLLSTATFGYFTPSTQRVSIVESVNTVGITQLTLGENQLNLNFNLLNSSGVLIDYQEDGFAIYNSTVATVTPIVNSVPEPASLTLLFSGLLVIIIVFYGPVKFV